MGSDESHFNVSVGSDGQSHKTASTNHKLSEEKREPPKRNRAETLLIHQPLGQTGSRYFQQGVHVDIEAKTKQKTKKMDWVGRLIVY